MTNGFYKVSASSRNDRLLQIGEKKWLLIFGFYDDDDIGSYNWRKNYGHKPTSSEVKSDVEALVNSMTDERIISGFVWHGIKVWLSAENQMNFKAAYDLAVQSDGATLPVKFKLGEDDDGVAVYHTFENIEEFSDFYTSAFGWIKQCLNDGWTEKDGIDY